ncbi:MAG TPA: putative toxin-antitoxin system toxin component, PIN family [Chitinophagaceae bacterium]|nr:putative toxin-antitoxin system toxin component, PIN family [Chitinophagaceae bacterium]
MKVVIDTNILLVSIPSKSKYRPIFEAWLFDKITLVVTSAIFFEYIEISGQQSKQGIAKYIEDALIAAKNVVTPSVYYRWQLISGDPDDNKFTDAYLAESADYLVTNDNHFNEAARIEFPKINVVSADKFLEILKDL